MVKGLFGLRPFWFAAFLVPNLSFRSELFTSNILTIFKQWNLFHKYEILTKIVIHACKNITELMSLLKMCGIGFVYLCFDPLHRKQLNSLFTIVSLTWLCCTKVTHPLWVQEVPGSIPSSSKGFIVWFFVLLCFYFFVQKHIICHNFLQFILQCELNSSDRPKRPGQLHNWDERRPTIDRNSHVIFLFCFSTARNADIVSHVKDFFADKQLSTRDLIITDFKEEFLRHNVSKIEISDVKLSQQEVSILIDFCTYFLFHSKSLELLLVSQ